MTSPKRRSPLAALLISPFLVAAAALIVVVLFLAFPFSQAPDTASTPQQSQLATQLLGVSQQAAVAQTALYRAAWSQAAGPPDKRAKVRGHALNEAQSLIGLAEGAVEGLRRQGDNEATTLHESQASFAAKVKATGSDPTAAQLADLAEATRRIDKAAMDSANKYRPTRDAADERAQAARSRVTRLAWWLVAAAVLGLTGVVLALARTWNTQQVDVGPSRNLPQAAVSQGPASHESSLHPREGLAPASPPEVSSRAMAGTDVPPPGTDASPTPSQPCPSEPVPPDSLSAPLHDSDGPGPESSTAVEASGVVSSVARSSSVAESSRTEPMTGPVPGSVVQASVGPALDPRPAMSKPASRRSRLLPASSGHACLALEGAEHRGLTLAAGSKCGLEHNAGGEYREDAWAWTPTSSGEAVVVAVADGVSQSRLSHAAALLAVEGVVEHLGWLNAETVASYRQNDQDWDKQARNALEAVAERLAPPNVEARAAALGWPAMPLSDQRAHDPATTLVVAAIVPRADGMDVLWCSVGDSSICTVDVAGQVKWLPPDAGRASGPTAALPRHSRRMRAGISTANRGKAVCLVTDGMADLFHRSPELLPDALSRLAAEPGNPSGLVSLLQAPLLGEHDDRTLVHVALHCGATSAP
jgi:hypothetical protein